MVAEVQVLHPARQAWQVLVPSAATTSNCPTGQEAEQTDGSSAVPAPEVSTNPFSQAWQAVALVHLEHDAGQSVKTVPALFRKNLSFAVLQAESDKHSLHFVSEVAGQTTQVLSGLRK